MLREPPVTNATFPVSVFDIVFFPFGSSRPVERMFDASYPKPPPTPDHDAPL
jgi:hypothetical protein